MLDKFKSHLRLYSKSQRYGIFVLLVIIGLLQFLLFSIKSDTIVDTSLEEIALQKQIDSLKTTNAIVNKPKIYPFNPNFISDFKGYQLGMSIDEINKLHQFRVQNKWINSTQQFQEVTKVSDSLLTRISPYFKFPDWVTNPKKKEFSNTSTFKINEKKEAIASTNDINKATQSDLRIINGIGEKISERIIKYRTKIQGFSFDSQVYEVWGLDKEVADKLLSKFRVIDKPTPRKININTASFKEVLKNPYIDYKLCKEIFNYRDEVAELQNINELKNIKVLTNDKFERICLYLKAE